MAAKFDRDQLLAAFDRLAIAAAGAGVVLHIAVYGGSALMLASNFRFTSEDVDVAEIAKPWPSWLVEAVAAISRDNGWSREWLNDAVQFHLSPLADRANDHVEFGTFPRSPSTPGMVVYVPTAEYMLALKLKAMRVLDPTKGELERIDILNLMKIIGIETPLQAIAIMKRYFPKSAAGAEKQMFLLKHILDFDGAHDAPAYPVGSV